MAGSPKPTTTSEEPTASGEYLHWAGSIRTLYQALHALAGQADALGIPQPNGLEWYEHLEQKLLPQVTRQPFLVVGVVGGTNIGKSVVFNHLAGEMASGISPLAAGTKHPVCLVPPGFTDEATLRALFPAFTLKPWKASTDPLLTSEENLMFWRVGQHVPPRLLLLDTPDIDSDAEVNWQRADAVRQVADVLVGVLTQQKYNDAAVKQFFRKAAEADKPIVVVFNQTNLQEDSAYWPAWIATFCTETGAHPDLLYVVPQDRVAARELRLPFHPLVHHTAAEDTTTTAPRRQHWEAQSPSSLRNELAALHFDAIKIRTFRGALSQVMDEARGAPAYLEQLRERAGEFASAAQSLSAADMAKVNWPTLPPRVVVDEIRAWWDEKRSDWSRKVHGGYRWMGQGLTWPVRKAWTMFQSKPNDPLTIFCQLERDAIVFAVQNLFEQLERLSKLGNATLRPRLLELLKGENRQRLLVQVQEAHTKMPAVDDDYRAFLHGELDQWSDRNRGAIRVLKSLDYAAAIARPAITISLCVSGWLVAGSLVQEAAVQAAAHSAGNLATEAAITGGITGGGELLVSSTSDSLGLAAARLFRKLQLQYAELRARWLAEWLEKELLGDLLAQLRSGADLPQSTTFQTADRLLLQLRNHGKED